MKKAVLLFILIIFISSCSTNIMNNELKKTDYFLGTIVSISVLDSGTADSDIIDECFNMISEYEDMFSYYDSNSELYRLNSTAHKKPFEASDELYEIITQSMFYCEKSNGALDIGLGQLIEIWDVSSQTNTVPDDGAISTFIGFSGYEHIVINDEDKTVFFDDSRVSVHLGACAKGFVQDKVVNHLKTSGVESALLDFGGSIYAIGTKNGNPFSIGIADPSSENDLVGTINLIDSSVVTSGNYRRFFEQDGIIYHHILDSDTAFPADNDINGVSIICESAFKGDCLSTASFVLGFDEAEKLLLNEQTAYIIITDESVKLNGVIFKDEK